MATRKNIADISTLPAVAQFVMATGKWAQKKLGKKNPAKVDRNASLLLGKVRDLESNVGVPVSTLRLRKALPQLSKREFDEAALELRKQHKVFLNRHADPYNISAADRDSLIADPRGDYFVAIAERASGKRNPAKFDRCVKAVKKKGGARNAYAVCKASTSAKNRATAALQSNLKKRKVVRHNPGDDAEAARYEYFHGRPPAEVITIRTPVHDPLNVKHSGIGKLMALEILSIDGTKKVTLERFKGTLLSQDKKGKQLYIDGGDQSARLSDFGIRYPHELEILGALLAVVYFTTKDHLRAEDGGTANYDHKFGGEGKQKRFVFGQHGSRLPLVGYDVRDKLLSIQGGGYELPAEGIDG